MSSLSIVASFIGSETLLKTVFSEGMEKLPLLVVVKPEYKNGKLVWEGSKGPEWQIRSGTSANVNYIQQNFLYLMCCLDQVWDRQYLTMFQFSSRKTRYQISFLLQTRPCLSCSSYRF